MCKKKGREWQSRYIPIIFLNSRSFIWCNPSIKWREEIQIPYVTILKFPALDFPISISAILYPLFIFTLYTNPLLVAHLNALLSAFTLGRIMCKCQKWICILKMNWNSMTQKTKIFWKSLNFWHEKSL